MDRKKRLLELIRVFGRLGLVAFGGPAAHIGMMEQEVVTRKKWMSREHFLDLVGATNLIPGPNSTEMTMHCGYERAGWPGLFTAGLAFILPAVMITGVIAWGYKAYGSLPAVEPFIEGIKPAVLVIIGQAIWKLGQKAAKSIPIAWIGAITLAISFAGVREIYAILLAGLLAVIWQSLKSGEGNSRAVKNSGTLWPFLLLSAGSTGAAISSVKLFWVFLKIGAILFGSGYVLVAYLDGELVERLGWLTEEVLLDAIAVGQFTPGPVLSTATFIGYQIDGVSGALAATAGIFLPSFLFVLLLNPLVPRLRRSLLAGAFLDGANIGAVAIMLAVGIELGMSVLTDIPAWIIGVSAVAAVYFIEKMNVMWLVAGAAAAGYLFYLAGL